MNINVLTESVIFSLSLIDSSRVYVPYPDPPSYSDGYVWPLYLKNRKVIEETVKDIGSVIF